MIGIIISVFNKVNMPRFTGKKRRHRPALARIRKRPRPSVMRDAGFLGVENKFFDVEADADAFAVTWATMEPATTNLTAVAQGDGESNRDGRKYAIRSIHIKGFVKFPAIESANAPVDDRLCRIALVLDTQTNNAQLIATNVFDGGQTDDVLAFRNLQFTRRFRVLMDKTIRVPVAQGSLNEGAVNLFAAPGTTIPFTFNKVFKRPVQVLMSGTTADIANVTDNSIHMIGVALDTSTALSYQCRIRFVG